jgi:hypothetical protein
MKLLATVSRKEVIRFYLEGEAIKKNKPIPATFGLLNLADPNATYQWLQENHYEPGVISGFAQLASVELSVDDIGNIAIVDGIFEPGSSKVLKNLAGTQEFVDWIPNRNPLPIWYGPLCATEWKNEYSTILRPPTPGGKTSWGSALRRGWQRKIHMLLP